MEDQNNPLAKGVVSYVQVVNKIGAQKCIELLMVKNKKSIKVNKEWSKNLDSKCLLFNLKKESNLYKENDIQ